MQIPIQIPILLWDNLTSPYLIIQFYIQGKDMELGIFFVWQKVLKKRVSQ